MLKQGQMKYSKASFSAYNMFLDDRVLKETALNEDFWNVANENFDLYWSFEQTALLEETLNEALLYIKIFTMVIKVTSNFDKHCDINFSIQTESIIGVWSGFEDLWSTVLIIHLFGS